MLILTRHDVETLLTLPAALSAVEEGFRQLALGNVAMPQRNASLTKHLLNIDRTTLCCRKKQQMIPID